MCAIRIKQNKVHKRDKMYVAECICCRILCLSGVWQKVKAAILVQEIEVLGLFPVSIFWFLHWNALLERYHKNTSFLLILHHEFSKPQETKTFLPTWLEISL